MILVKITQHDWVNPREVAAVTRDGAFGVVRVVLSCGERVNVGRDNVAGVDLLQRTIDRLAEGALAEGED
ncbi:hypothetical protein [Microbacterium rhizophilus]|uniref:hypothetical protein n=1 Tax=Microbacterium rhizophilus TaxID=3138934 RepID=UPI0031F0355E